jgi:hypothetical protein
MLCFKRSSKRCFYKTINQLINKHGGKGFEPGMKDGTERSMEDVVKYLIETYKKENKKK